MKIAVVGGGIFGCTAAIHAARAGHEVHLFERAGALMQAASGVNQLRLHEGFHYPRSPETVEECQAGLASFRREYGSAIAFGGLQYYAIAKEGSRVSGAAYQAFCDRHRLTATDLYPAGCPYVSRKAVEAWFPVREARIDLHELRSLVVRKLEGKVAVHFEPATMALRDKFDRIVIAAYASTNEVARDLGAPTESYQFEVVEKPVVRMPPGFSGVSIVVLDGPFCCIDPYAETGLHLMGHAAHAIHASNVGEAPVVPRHLAPFLNRGVVPAASLKNMPSGPPSTRFRWMVEDGERFIPGLAKAEHLGSMFTVRAVLPNRDATDERPTLVQRLDPQVVRVFSGKIGTAVVAARQALALMEERELEAA